MKMLLDNSDILLVIPPPFITKMPHLGVAYLAAFLKSKGIRAGVYDLNLELYNSASPELKFCWRIDCLNSLFVTEVSKKILSNFEEKVNIFVDALISAKIRIIGFSVNMVSIFVANEIARRIKLKDKSKIIIFGGAGTFFKSPRDLMEFCFADILVIGEGEETLFDIVDSVKKGRRIKNKKGILLGKYYNRNYSLPSRPIEDLDNIPFPNFEEFSLTEYNDGDTYKPLPLLLSRGCIGHCSYCIDCIMWPGFRYRSAANIFKEIEYHITENKIRAFEFNDLTCNGNLGQLSKLCDLIIESGFKFNWVSYAIIRKDMTEELLLKLKKSGCHTLIYGLESGSGHVLRKMRKIYTPQTAQDIIRATHNAGINVNVNLIVGFPGETKENFNETAGFIYRNKDCIAEITNVSACTLFPEAEIGRLRNKYGVIWQKGTDPMLFCDINGAGRQERNKRVEEMLKILETFNIQKTIVNKPELNPVVASQMT